ncbi:MAG: hypothetical protein U9Q71_02230 [Pseudomonadota bacterium]|nr:hypothetical protein [Pseudomonadota bacterium]
MAVISTLKNWVISIWGFFWNSVVRVLWLCAYSTVAAVAVAYLFIGNDQGQDLLRISIERGFSLWNILFAVGAVVLSLALWYSARLLLGREFKCYPLDLNKTRLGRKWLPRLLGGSVPLSIAMGFLLVNTDAQAVKWILAAVYLILTVTLVWFFIVRRRLFLGGSSTMIDTQVAELEKPSRAVIVVAVGLSFALLISFLVWPVGLPQMLGAPAIFALGFAGIALFGSMVLTYAFLAKGQPTGTALVLALAVAFGFLNDNHWVRLDNDAEPLARRSVPAEQYRKWRVEHPGFGQIDGREPVILVAASGGGIRAAYWTASALASLEKRIDEKTINGFTNNLFAVSGVSGGSVGAATYAALRREQLATKKLGDMLGKAREVLGKDFLSPVVAGLLFTDLAQRFIPIPIRRADRQRFLEKAWEDAFGPRPNLFSDAFAALYDAEYKDRLPSLLLNTTVVDSGRRAIVSNIDVGGFTDTLDLLQEGYSTQRLKLSAAAGASARFTYVSPAGSLETHKGKKMRVVDGGYFENSGAATAMDLLTALRRSGPDLFPILILIRNDPGAPPVCRRNLPGEGRGEPGAGEFLNDVSAPIRALLNARTARARLAEVDTARTVEALNGAVIEIPLAAVTERESTLAIARDEKEGQLATARDEEERTQIRNQIKKQVMERMVEPPLGWSLSEYVRTAMDQALDHPGGGLDKEFRMLEAVLNDNLANYRACNAQ